MVALGDIIFGSFLINFDKIIYCNDNVTHNIFTDDRHGFQHPPPAGDKSRFCKCTIPRNYWEKGELILFININNSFKMIIVVIIIFFYRTVNLHDPTA